LKGWQHLAGDNDYSRVNWYEPTLSPKSTWATNTKLLMALSTTGFLLRVVVGCRRSGPCIYTQNGGVINGFLYWSPPCWADGAVLEYKLSILWSFLIQDSLSFFWIRNYQLPLFSDMVKYNCCKRIKYEYPIYFPYVHPLDQLCQVQILTDSNIIVLIYCKKNVEYIYIYMMTVRNIWFLCNFSSTSLTCHGDS
jgi:hypothetical protein